MTSNCSECSNERRRGYATCADHAEVAQSFSSGELSDAPSEPDWESIVADREADAFDEDRMQDRADRAVYGD